MAKRPTKLDRDLGYGLQAHQRPVKDDAETVDCKTTSTSSEATVAPAGAVEETTEAEEIATLRRLHRQQLIKQMQSGTVRASMLAEVGKFLRETGALDHKPGKTKQKPTGAPSAVIKDLPFPVVPQVAASENSTTEWKIPSR